MTLSMYTLIPTVYRALLKSAVSGTDHRIHTTKKSCCAEFAFRSKHFIRFIDPRVSELWQSLNKCVPDPRYVTHAFETLQRITFNLSESLHLHDLCIRRLSGWLSEYQIWAMTQQPSSQTRD